MLTGQMSKTFASPRSGSRKISDNDDRASNLTNNNKNKSKTNRSTFDVRKFQEERYAKVKNGLEAVLHLNDISK